MAKQKDFINLISSLNWKFAKTMPEIPHEYIVIDDYPEKSDSIREFIQEIENDGYTSSFFDKEYKYFDINGYKYWVIGNIINRAKLTNNNQEKV